MTITARELMTTDLYTVSPEMPLIELDQELFKRKISGAPVEDNGQLVGIVSRTDLSHKLSDDIKEKEGITSYFFEADGTAISMVHGLSSSDSQMGKLRHYTVEDVMATWLISVPPSAPISSVAKLMVGHKIHRVLVVDNQQLVGLITTLDIVKTIAES